MKRAVPVNQQKPNLSRTEAKADTTSRVAREIVDREAAAQAAKTERLRAARLARETAEQAAPAIKKDRRARWSKT